jgi:NAD(P)H-dependent FMN reductase
MKPRLEVIVGSTRPGRVSISVGHWLVRRAMAHDAFDVGLADLAEIGLPLMDEPNLPRLRRYVHQHTKDWSARVDAADAFVLIAPEYNCGFPAPLKNALDYLHDEWEHKPVGFVSYGGVSAGTRGVQMLKQVVTTLKMLPVTEAVAIPFFRQFLDGSELRPNAIMEHAAGTMLDELARLEAALRPLRACHGDERRLARA